MKKKTLVFASIILFFTLTACNSKDNVEINNEEVNAYDEVVISNETDDFDPEFEELEGAATSQEATEKYMQDFKKADIDFSLWIPDDLLDLEDQTDVEPPPSSIKLEELIANTEYELKDIDTEGNKSTINVEVTGIDLNTIMSEYYNQLLFFMVENTNMETGEVTQITPEEENELLLAVMEETPFSTREGIFKLEKQDGKWIITNEAALGKLMINLDAHDIKMLLEPTNDNEDQ